MEGMPHCRHTHQDPMEGIPIAAVTATHTWKKKMKKNTMKLKEESFLEQRNNVDIIVKENMVFAQRAGRGENIQNLTPVSPNGGG